MKLLLLNTGNYFVEKLDYIVGFIAVFIMNQRAAFIAVGTLVFIDLFTGLWNAIKFKEPITSRRLKDTVTKLVLYNLLIITCMVTEYYLLTRIPFIEVCLGIIATVETTSIFENIEKVLNIRIVNRFKSLLKKGKDSADKTKKENKDQE